ncbi:MAG: hypothetical protein N3A72_00605 [bacterium]|nr:hypothetical protein [bacterium]
MPNFRQIPIVIQLRELVADIFGTILLALRQRRPTVQHCPIFIVKILSFIPGVGHMFTGYYIRGIFWFIIALPIIVAFSYVIVTEKFTSQYTWHTLEAIGAMYLVLVYFCSRDIGNIVNAKCGTERFIEYFEREKAVARKYKEFLERQYNQKPDDEIPEDIVTNKDHEQNKSSQNNKLF